jgi:hypothetical protein
MYELNSHDYLCDVDDPHGYLARCLSETVLNSFNANGVPKHVLRLKVDDICIVTRALPQIHVSKLYPFHHELLKHAPLMKTQEM